MDTLSIPQKKCTKCGKIYPATLEFFEKHPTTLDRLHTQCRECKRQHNREYYVQHREQLTQYARERRAKEPEKVHEEQKQQREKHKDQIRERNRVYVANHSDRARKWYLDYAHSAKGKARVHRRYAREKGTAHDFTAQDWRFALDYWGDCCAVCGRPRGLWHQIAPDHWVPLAKGGATVPENIIPMCNQLGGCNSSKRDSDAVEWLIRKLGKRAAKKKLAEIMTFFSIVRKRE